ncbi:ubiquitin C-terminal hydrolase Ubp14 [Yamadazyma tenuis]|uniref:Ubiquitin carboxyl-terminal hydrolase n=1 Tax=Candida tenuis (strain ATCC 10573 / BCRC 21748 / CBS 615 / JCM 9827 / NBRC 10315 / NRRL Y-1498 / VKM Y-70) TaxID=590646 RepID=G3AZ50_CANTC|nr:uncharacterized protein CANTEDRAFT_133441 [Yamadazyma tenuis ATCC 10573]EGV66009.1 hypothetical protein CANTEDRAFT_133441 [Yamadazyma tenuis ATCC 10573]WEJ95652.1 ubiquitin C-terminal hydrolase Ubp14 [Yamadazyma tenuis]
MSYGHLSTREASFPAAVSPGTVVYKDDCMYNFDTAENNSVGLDVCLSCYKAYSRSHVDYTKQHTRDSNHDLFLNIIKRLKPLQERERSVTGNGSVNDDGNERQAKIAKLEIKEFKEEELYDIFYSIYSSTENLSVPLNETPAKFQSLANSIISANSSNRQEEIKAWEQEILPCEHSIEVEQFPNDALDISKCSQCSLVENLWICLHCGALGCGRQQFGSTIPGNSHALKHFEDVGHPVAVKLGSLSATEKDNYDAYCYKCNDEVKVPNLVSNLQKYGIDLDSTVKTEKNLTEINLDQNMNWEFQLDGKNGEKLKPIFGSNFTGLTNLGNSCYLNSVVQALFHLQPYLLYFKNQKFPSYEKVPNPSKDLLSQLLKVHDGLVSGRYSKPGNSKGEDYQLGIKPMAFKSLVGEDHEEFKTNRQQDAFEFLTYLLDKIDKQFGFEVNESFKFLMTNKLLCGECFSGKASDELVDNLSVNVEDEVVSTDEEGNKVFKKVNMLDCIRNYCADEVIEGYRCEVCDKPTEAVKSCGFKSFPEVLILNAKRIKLENWVPVKIDVPIDIPYELDLNGFKVELDDTFKVDKSEPAKFTANEEILNNLLQMGFPEPRCIKALYTTGNSNLDDAMNWIFAHMEDEDIDVPLEIDSAPTTAVVVSDESVNNLTAMGFSAKLANKALVVNNNDANAAVEWLFNNPDDDGEIVETTTPVDLNQQRQRLAAKLEEDAETGQSGSYKIKAVVCHKGTSPHTGHYVVYIRQTVGDAEKWVLYNDEKVVECDDSSVEGIETNGYIYVFERI